MSLATRAGRRLSRSRSLALAFAVATASAEPGCDLSEPDYATFRARAQLFYKLGIFEFADAENVNSFLEARDALLPICPVAVLQALLLKLEENLIYEPRAYQELMAEYARYLHAALLQGSLTRDDVAQWPLAHGVERTAALSRSLAQGQKLTSAMVLNFCQPEDRFGAVHGLAWLLEPPFGEPDAAAVSDSGLLTDTDLYVYLVDAPWCRPLDPALVKQLQRVARTVQLVPYVGGPGREEQSAYFKFIVDHYDAMPDFTIFVHPDAPEHQGPDFQALRRALKAIRTQSTFAQEALGYYPLARQMVVDPKRTWGQPYVPTWRRFWQRLYGHTWHELGFHPPRCRWELHAGAYIADLAEGEELLHSRAGAKAVCERLGDACEGVTCGTPGTDGLRGSCTARKEGLLASPSQETSYVKRCAAEGASAHADAVAPETEVHSHAATYVHHRGRYLSSFAAGDGESRTADTARKRCDELGDACGGFTCESDGAPCTVRAGSELLPSPTGEASFVKRPVVTGPGLRSDVRGATTVFQFYTGSQSVVRKDRILRWPREEYAAFGADGAFCSEYTGYFEAVWHAMFGEPLSQWPREHDPSLPLYLKWGLVSTYSYGDEGVV